MADNLMQLQRQAARRVQQMQEHSRRVFEAPQAEPTPPPPPKPALSPHLETEQWLLLGLALLLIPSGKAESKTSAPPTEEEWLMRVQEELRQQGLGLKVWDGFRPAPAQFRLWEICPDPVYVSNPDNGFSKHSRGNTVDVTLVYADGTFIICYGSCGAASPRE